MARVSHKKTRPNLLLDISICVLCLLCVTFSQAQPDSRRITFYTAQTSYSLPVFDRNGTEYFGLLEALEPMGLVSARVEGSKWKLKFRDIDAQFEVSSTRAKIHGKNVQLTAPFMIENSRGLVPLSSIKAVLPLFGIPPLDYHEASRRIFIGAPIVHFTAKKLDTGKIAFTFSAPVNPFVATEAGKLRMAFDREPLQADTAPIDFDDKLVTSVNFSETNGSAELTVNGTTPLMASFSDDRKTITISAIPPAPQQTATNTNGPAVSSTPNGATPATAQSPAPVPRPRPFVIIDPAHGGTDQGAPLTPKLAEKDLSLTLALRLRHDLEARGIPCALVRDGDATLTFDQRAAIANASNASLYIALHASSTGSGVRIYSSMLTPANRAPLAFVPVQMAQASRVSQSRVAASAMTDTFLKRDVPAASLPASIAPLNSIGIPAIVLEVGPPPTGADDFATPGFQQSTASSIAAAIAAAQSQLSREVAP